MATVGVTDEDAEFCCMLDRLCGAAVEEGKQPRAVIVGPCDLQTNDNTMYVMARWAGPLAVLRDNSFPKGLAVLLVEYNG